MVDRTVHIPLEGIEAIHADWAGGAHGKRLGPTDAIPFLKQQTRLTFARVGVIDPLDPADYEAAARWGAQECVRCGITSVADMAYEGTTVARAAVPVP